MEKRLFLAIALSMLVLLLYSGVISRFLPPAPQNQNFKDVTLNSTISYEKQPTLIPSQEKAPLAETFLPKEKLLVLENNEWSLFVDPNGTALQEVTIKAQKFNLPQRNIAKLTDWADIKFIENNIIDGMAMSYDNKKDGFEIKKTYQFSDDKFILEMSLEFISHSKEISYIQYGLNIGTIDAELLKEIKIDAAEQRYLEISISLPDKVLRHSFFNFNPPSFDKQPNWIGIRDRYFCSIVRPMQEAERIIKSVNGGTTSYILQSKKMELAPQQKITHTYKIYLGPQNQDLISKLGAGSENIINFGFFDTVSQILLGTLHLINRFCNNWGLTLVIFSLLVFVLMYPLSAKSFSSMKRMQELQPAMEELKIKFKDSPQKLHKETLELYRREKINPMGGCLPLILQMPIFISLFQLLMRFVELKGARFLWIKDLAEPDRLYVFNNMPKSFPIIGNELNLLPIIMIITMVVQQKLTGAKQSSTKEMAQQQKMMSLFMVIFFGIIFYHMPAGLVLYWSVNSVLTLFFQMKIFKLTAKQKA